MDWPEAVNNALSRTDERVVSLAVIVVIVGGVVAVISKARELLGVRPPVVSTAPPTTLGELKMLIEDLKKLSVEMEHRFNMRAERIELRIDKLYEDGHDRDVAIARLEVRLQLDPIINKEHS